MDNDLTYPAKPKSLSRRKVVRNIHWILSAVDNRTFRRLIYEVLGHARTQKDIVLFLERLKNITEARGRRVSGITTDASALYPEAIRLVFRPRVRHRVCEFHVISELCKAILKALCSIRRQLRAQIVRLPRGKPADPRAQRRTAQNHRLRMKTRELLDRRHLLVKRSLTSGELVTLRGISRRRLDLKIFRQIMDGVYRLFDRRCGMEPAPARLKDLREHVRWFPEIASLMQKLFSSNLEKALTFLDDSLLPATSNAVERTDRRYRKMQKTVYRVRTQPAIQVRVALDMVRDQRREDRDGDLRSLHHCRSYRENPMILPFSVNGVSGRV